MEFIGKKAIGHLVRRGVQNLTYGAKVGFNSLETTGQVAAISANDIRILPQIEVLN